MDLEKMMRVGIAADHGGFNLKMQLINYLQKEGHEVVDFGAHKLISDDDFPDYIVPLARAVSGDEIIRGIAICGSGVGASVVANKIQGIRAALITESYSARQGVEDDAMNVICLGGLVTGYALACELINIFLSSKYKGEERFNRRLKKIAALENSRREI